MFINLSQKIVQLRNEGKKWTNMSIVTLIYEYKQRKRERERRKVNFTQEFGYKAIKVCDSD